MAVQGCFAAQVVPSLPLKMWKASQHTAACPRQGTERLKRRFGEQLYGNLDFHTWERKLRALPGFIIGLGVGMVKPVCSHSTLPETRGVSETGAVNAVTRRGGRTHHQPRPGGSSSESPSQQEFWGPGEVWIPAGSSCLGGCCEACAGPWGMCQQRCSLLRAAFQGSAYP